MSTDYPKRTMCRYCDHPLSLAGPDAQWLDPWSGRECADAPNPEDGPMPSHEPGAAILSPSSPRICMAIARKGTGYGQCQNTLDAHDRCDRADDHV